MGHARKRGERATGGCEGRRERRQEHLRDGQRGETRSRHGVHTQHGGEKGGRRSWESDYPWGLGETMGTARPPEWTPIPTEWSGRRGAARSPEWRKIQGGSAMEWKEGSSRPRTTRPPPPLFGGPSLGFSPLRRPRGPPLPTPSRGDWGPLRRPRAPQSFPPLPRGRHIPHPGGLPFSLP